MLIAATGHRPHKTSYEHDSPLRCWLREQIALQLRILRPLYGVSGMALGWDQDFAEVCIALRIPFIAAVPFVGQDSRWPYPARRFYKELLAQAYEVFVICDGTTDVNSAMTIRNHWMVDHSNVLLAGHNGSPGGTANTVLYAARMRRPTITINPLDFRP